LPGRFGEVKNRLPLPGLEPHTARSLVSIRNAKLVIKNCQCVSSLESEE